MSDHALVFSGSAALYPAHLGAAQALYESVFAGTKPRALVGTSGGAIVASFLATGQQPKDGLPLLQRLIPRKLIRKNWASWLDRLTLKRRPRLGAFTLERVEACLAHHVPRVFANVTIPLYITATDLAKGELVVFSQDTNPMMPVAQAAAISASMPGLFAVTNLGDRCLTDGGLLNNYPVDLLEGPSVGIQLRGQGENPDRPVYPRNELELGIRCLAVMHRGLEREHVEDAEAWARTIVVDVPWSALDFLGLDEQVVELLYDVGYRQTKHALDQGVYLAL